MPGCRLPTQHNDAKTDCQDIFLDALKVAELPLSPKCSFKISETGKLIGMHWMQDGHCLDDDAVESLLLTLARKPVTKTNAKQVTCK